MRKYLYNILTFMIIWFCSGFALLAYKDNYFTLGLSFTLLSCFSFVFMNLKEKPIQKEQSIKTIKKDL